MEFIDTLGGGGEAGKKREIKLCRTTSALLLHDMYIYLGVDASQGAETQCVFASIQKRAFCVWVCVVLN